MLYRACATANPFPDPYMAAIAKITVNEMALRVTSEAIQVHGGYGFTDEFPVSRLLSRRALRLAGRRHDGDAEGPRRQEASYADFGPEDGFLGFGGVLKRWSACVHCCSFLATTTARSPRASLLPPMR